MLHLLKIAKIELSRARIFAYFIEKKLGIQQGVR